MVSLQLLYHLSRDITLELPVAECSFPTVAFCVDVFHCPYQRMTRDHNADQTTQDLLAEQTTQELHHSVKTRQPPNCLIEDPT